MFHDVYNGWLLLIRFVLFYKLYSKHLELFTKDLRTPHYSWGFPFSFSQCLRHSLEVPKLSLSSALRRRLQSCQKIFFNNSHAIWLVRPVQSPWGSMILSPGIQPFYRSSGGAYFGLFIAPKFPIFLGFSRSSREDCSVTVSNAPVSLLPVLCFTLLVT